jgi:hypothetical protein
MAPYDVPNKPLLGTSTMISLIAFLLLTGYVIYIIYMKESKFKKELETETAVLDETILKKEKQLKETASKNKHKEFLQKGSRPEMELL